MIAQPKTGPLSFFTSHSFYVRLVTAFVALLCREFRRGFDAYLHRDWSAGAGIFGRLARKFPDDGPVALYLQRCRRYQEQPPGPDWRGVTFLESK